MELILKTPAATLPLDWAAEVSGHLRVDTDEDERARVESVLIPAAASWAEGVTGRQLIRATWTLYLRGWPAHEYVELPRPPLISVTHVKYVDTAGVTQTLDASTYSVLAPSGDRCPAGRVYPAYGLSWPAVRDYPRAIEIEFVAGYGSTSSAVPALIRAGLLLIVGELFENREESIRGPVSPAQRSALSLLGGFLVNV